MDVVQAICNVGQLVKGFYRGKNTTREAPTSPSWSALEFFFMYSGRFPQDIQSEISWRGEVVTPMKGTIFGWFKHFHTMASWQNGYDVLE